MAGKPVGLLSELIVVINDNNDNAVHVYRTKSWTVLVVTVTAKIVTIKCLIVLSLFPFYFSIKVSTIIALGIQQQYKADQAHAHKTMTTIK